MASRKLKLGQPDARTEHHLFATHEDDDDSSQLQFLRGIAGDLRDLTVKVESSIYSTRDIGRDLELCQKENAHLKEEVKRFS